MKLLGIASMAFAALAFTLPAEAGSGSGSHNSVKVGLFYIQQSSATSDGPFFLRLDSTTSTAFDAGCDDGGYIKVETSYMSAKNMQYIKDILLASQLSGKRLRVSTTGCLGSYAKLSTLGFSDI